MSEEANQLYHYTSMNALFHILNDIKDENLTLRATHYQYLNDTTECKLLNEYHNKYNSDNQTPSRLKEAYITSFSKSKDNLTMYRHYGNAKGTSLHFDIESLDNEIKQNFCDCEYISNEIEYKNIIDKSKEITFDKSRLDMESKLLNKHNEMFNSNIDSQHLKCISDSNSQAISRIIRCFYSITESEFSSLNRKLTKETEDYLSNIYLKKYFSSSIYILKDYSVKHSSFGPENEKRLIKFKEKSVERKFFEKDGLIKPYIEVQIPVTALKQIWLAPGCDEELSRKSILMLLESKGVTHITESDIMHSKHPYIDR